MEDMAIAQSKITAQGQISVPAEIRKRLGMALRVGSNGVERGRTGRTGQPEVTPYSIS
jgi:bifunctional DNA-binding transcriptional regulator/antitoxin component of YhaV-PrlF toxin-antitoxin module